MVAHTPNAQNASRSGDDGEDERNGRDQLAPGASAWIGEVAATKSGR
jgi:hypothetical protein